MIKLKKLVLKNFKGIKEKTIEFGHITNILADNGGGKTSIFDAFCWLLFGKDSLDRQKFDVQTLDSNNNIIHNLEHSVTGYLDIDGVQKVITRTLKEKWQKSKGKADAELKGCTTDYEIDGIPVKQKEYQATIGNLVDENLFKMITNPFYFNSLHWTKQREILFEIIGNIDDKNVINYRRELDPLTQILGNDDVDTFNKKIKATISKLKEKVKDIPARIDENNSNIVELNFAELEIKKMDLQVDIYRIDEQIVDASKANDEKIKLQEMFYQKKEEQSKKINEALKNSNTPLEEINDEIFKVNEKLHQIKYEISNMNSEKENNIRKISAAEENYNNLSIRRKELLAKYHEEDDKDFEFDTSLSCCPTCGREYDQDKIEEIKTKAEEKFNNNKKNTIDAIVAGGKRYADNMKASEKTIEELKERNKTLEVYITTKTKEKEEIESHLESLNVKKSELSITKEIHFEGQEELRAEIEELEKQIEQFQEADNSELKAKKRVLQEELEEVTKILGKKDTNNELKKRIEELNQEEKRLNAEIAKLEGQQFLCEEFIRTKVELLESSINKKFKGAVSFKLFINHIGGGLEECCEALINGVPFGNANKASQYNAGLSIINTLCEHYEVSAPVFIDNAEAVNELVDTESQLIKLVVSKDKELKVEVDE